MPIKSYPKKLNIVKKKTKIDLFVAVFAISGMRRLKDLNNTM